MINSFARENQHVIDQVFQLMYYFRGALSRDDAFAMTSYERDQAIEFLNKRFKEAGEAIKKNIPVFV